MRGNGYVAGGVVAAAVLSVLVATPAWAAGSGSLDPGFGSAGEVSTSMGGVQTVYGMAVQPDGRIVAAGYANRSGQYDFALARYTADGTLDPTFGSGGTVLTDVGGNSSYDVARALALQPDGKIVVAGQSSAGAGMALARYNADGSLDSGFGTGGVVATRIPGIAYATAVQPDGRILIAGSADTGTSNDIAVARFQPDGSPDPSFGSGGTVLTDVSGTGSNDVAYAMALQPDGAVLAAGSSGSTDGTTGDFALLRYRPNGTLDSGFGSGGKVLTSVGNTGRADTANALAVRPDGTIVVAGSSQTPGGTSDFALARYRPDGSLDPTFGTGGTTVTGIGGAGSYAFASAVVVDASGRIVVAGSAGQLRSADFAVARYTPNGALDPTFGSQGTVVTDFGGFDDRAFVVRLQTDGKILAAGYSGGPFFADFAMTRYLP